MAFGKPNIASTKDNGKVRLGAYAPTLAPAKEKTSCV